MPLALKGYSRILFINPFGIGDVLFTTPLLAQVRRLLPQAKIGFLCNRRAYPILRNNPHVDDVWVLERDEFRALWRKSKRNFLKEAWGLYQRIKSQGYQLAFDLSLSNQFGFFLRTMGVKTRIGFRYRKRGRFLRPAVPFTGYRDKHVAEYQLDLLKQFSDIPPVKNPRMTLASTTEDEAEAARLLESLGLTHRSHGVAIAPGGGDSWGPNAHYKRWSPEHFAGLIHLLQRDGYPILMLGSHEDRQLVNEIANGMQNPLLSLAGECSLTVSAAVLRHCSFLIANDGGLLHLAVAQDIPTASFFGPTDDRVYGPFPKSSRHLVLAKQPPCRPCYQNFRMPPCSYDKRCLEEWSAQEVFEKIKLWSKNVIARSVSAEATSETNEIASVLRASQ